MNKVPMNNNQKLNIPGYSGMERRRNVRVSPITEGEIVLTMDGSEYLVSDISEGGVSFWIPESDTAAMAFTNGAALKLYIQLPNAEKPFPVIVSILARMPNGLVRCSFKKAHKESMLLVKQYVVIRVQESVGVYF